jgi:hypothetical protein
MPLREQLMPVTKEQFESTLRRVAERLLEEVPGHVASLGLCDPAYCILLLYEDGTSDDVTPTLLVSTKPHLDACNARQCDGIGDQANQGKAWKPQQCISSPFPGYPLAGGPIGAVAEDTMICYRYEIFEPDDLRDNPDGFREMLIDVARRLNDLIWQEIIPVTENFFVLATDYSAFNFFDDLPKCVSITKLEQLRVTYASLADVGST